MVMEYGLIKEIFRYIQEVIEWIKNKGLVYINGKGNKHTKGILNKIIEMDMVDCIELFLMK